MLMVVFPAPLIVSAFPVIFTPPVDVRPSPGVADEDVIVPLPTIGPPKVLRAADTLQRTVCVAGQARSRRSRAECCR